jgi:hypothetical protein
MINSIFFGIIMFFIVLSTSKIKLRLPLFTKNDYQKRLPYFLFGMSYGMSWDSQQQTSFWVGYFVCIGLMVSLLFYYFVKVIITENKKVYDFNFQSCVFSFVSGSVSFVFLEYLKKIF